MLKKLCIVLLGAVLVTSFFASCGKSVDSTTEGTEYATETKAEESLEDQVEEQTTPTESSSEMGTKPINTETVLEDSTTTQAPEIIAETTTEMETKKETEEVKTSAKDPTTQPETTKAKETQAETKPKETEKSTTAAETKPKETTAAKKEESKEIHEHNWVPWLVFTEVKEQGHWETVLIDEEWIEDVYECHVVCNACGAFLEEDDPGRHQVLYCKSSYTEKEVKVGEIVHEAIYEEQWIIDVPGGTRSEIKGVRCNICGETVEE